MGFSSMLMILKSFVFITPKLCCVINWETAIVASALLFKWKSIKSLKLVSDKTSPLITKSGKLILKLIKPNAPAVPRGLSSLM